MRQIQENTLLHIFLKEWVPALITTIIGGGLIALLLPHCQADFEQSRAHQARRLALTESTVKSFTAYILGWGKLRHITELEVSTGQLAPDEHERKNAYVKERDEAGRLLYSDLETATLYFKPEVKGLVAEFMAWDRAQSTKRRSQSPVRSSGAST